MKTLPIRTLAIRIILGFLACGITAVASGQSRTLRIVCYNIQTDTSVTNIPSGGNTTLTTATCGLIAPYNLTQDSYGDWFTTNCTGSVTNGGVLEGIGEENLAGDPAQPIDILALEETTSNTTTVQPTVNGLNAFYAYYTNPAGYAMSTYQATESHGDPNGGNGPNALIYNTNTLQLLASVPVDPPGGTSQLGSASGEYREVMRYEFAPAGVTTNASNVFYVYVSHYKSGSPASNATYRNEEAQIIRNDETSLPANARVLYVGDFNLYLASEPAYSTILSNTAPNGVMQGQGIDPLNVPGSTNIDWEDYTTNPAILLMLTEDSYYLNNRCDFQIMTSNVYYDVAGGLQYVQGTCHAFGNNASIPYDSMVTASGNTALNDLDPAWTNLTGLSATVLLNDLTGAADHLPVVADYTIPANSWTDGTGKWETSANWSFGAAPSSGDVADLATNAGNKTVTVDVTTVLSNNLNGCMTVKNLYIAGTANSTNTLALSNTGTLSTPFLIEGALTIGGGGVITVTNSALEVDETGGPAHVDGVLVGVVGSGNSLAITNGGALYDNNGILGSNSTSSGNSVLVAGTGSAWSNNYNLVLGYNGAGNTLTISNAGQVVDGYGYVGYNASSSNNVALVTGSGSVWSNTGTLSVGYSGAGNQLAIANGSKLVGGTAYVGFNAGSSNNVALVTGSGSVWSNTGTLSVGYNGAGNTLTISNSGQVVSGYGYLGYNSSSSSNNAVLVTGPGSVWSNQEPVVGYNGAGNTLTISNGGQVLSQVGYLGYESSSSYNTVLVTGTGSVWNSDVPLVVGGNNPVVVGLNGAGNTLTISNGGAVVSADGIIGSHSSSSNNTAIVTGPGSVWNAVALGAGGSTLYGVVVGGSASNRSTLLISNGGAVVGGGDSLDGYSSATVTGPGSVWSNQYLTVGTVSAGNQLIIANGGAVITVTGNGSGYLGNGPGCSNNVAFVTGPGSVWSNQSSLYVGLYGSGNQLTVSNSGAVFARTLLLGMHSASQGTLTLAGGAVNVANLIVTNAGCAVAFNGGTLTSGGTAVTNAQVFVVGDGVDAATFQLNGGVHSFANGVEIRNDATLSGCGTINANVLVDAGGTVLANCGGTGTMTFTGIVTNNGTVRAIDGSTLEAYGLLVNNGTVDAINGGTNFHAGVVNHGTILTAANVAISQVSPSGPDFVVQIPSVTGHTYQLQYTTSLTSPNWINIVGQSQSGTGGVLTLEDTGGAANPQRFYRVMVTAP